MKFQQHSPTGQGIRLSAWRQVRRRDRWNVGYGIVVLVGLVVSSLLSLTGILPQDPDEMNLAAILAGPFTEGHLLGTDFLGRDQLTRLILAARSCFVPGLLAVLTALSLGVIAGVTAGYLGGRPAAVVVYLGNLLDSFPRLMLILFIIAALEANIGYIMVVVGLTAAPMVAAIVAGRIRSLMKCNFVESARAMGFPVTVIIFKHLLWYNCRVQLLIQATLILAEAILIETSLSYLGFGVQEPVPSWGNMVQSGAAYLLQGNPWPSTFPALAIMFTILGLHLLGDGLRHIMERWQ